MANEEHVKLLRQGVEVWNRWRTDNPDVEVNLACADVSRANLQEVNFKEANLYEINLKDANLKKANLKGALLQDATLSGASLIEANIKRANLIGANLVKTNLEKANLSGADLTEANMLYARLREARLLKTSLVGTNLTRTILRDADFRKAVVRHTNFCGVNLGDAKNLQQVTHAGPSYLDRHTLVISRGQISTRFLRGCGLSDWEIENAKLYDPDLSNETITNVNYKIHELRAERAFQINPLFISYSHINSEFVDTIEKRLIKNGIRFWRDIHDAKAGRLETQIDAAIQAYDVVLLILSEHSTKSDWVEHEARKAREKEKKAGKDVLCPIALDDSWLSCRWPVWLREQIRNYHVLDFSNWKDEAIFQRQFAKLLEGLNLFYK